jgi:hypothetical protein
MTAGPLAVLDPLAPGAGYRIKARTRFNDASVSAYKRPSEFFDG